MPGLLVSVVSAVYPCDHSGRLAPVLVFSGGAAQIQFTLPEEEKVKKVIVAAVLIIAGLYSAGYYSAMHSFSAVDRNFYI